MFDLQDAPFIDDAAWRSGIAFTDIVKFPTPGEKQVSAGQIRTGLPVLKEALAARGALGDWRVPASR